MVTVGLAGMLRREIGGGRLGLCIGVGTGIAYAVCNLPSVFGGAVHTQAMMGIVAACTSRRACRSIRLHWSMRSRADWALGIGMADNLRLVPGGFLLIADGVVSMLLGWRGWKLRAGARSDQDSRAVQ